MEHNENLYFAFALTLFAGLSTGIGSAIAFFSKKTNKTFLAFALGFSAGVMIYVSFVDIFQKAQDSLILAYGESHGTLVTVISFFCGIAVIMLIDALIPSAENPHEAHFVEEIEDEKLPNKRLLRMGTFTALAIAIHNFPEGLATFTASLNDPGLGIAIAIAIAIHNIPEGIAVSVPIYYATGKKRKAFLLSALSGLSEPLGALLGWWLFMPFFTDATFGILFASVGGIMVFISIDELIPTAREYDSGHKSVYGFVLGMLVMASSLILFQF